MIVIFIKKNLEITTENLKKTTTTIITEQIKTPKLAKEIK